MSKPNNFPHGELSMFNYAYILSYPKYTRAYNWCKTNTRQFWQVYGDPDTQLYRFGFIDSREYTMFLINHSDVIIYSSKAEDPL